MNLPRAKRLGREFIWVCIGQTLVVIGAIVGVRVLTELLSPEQYGQLALGLTAATFVNVVLLGPIINAAVRFYSAAVEEKALRHYLSALFYMVKRMCGYIGLVSLVLVFVMLVWGQGFLIGIFVVAISYALLTGIVAIFDGIQNAARHRSIVALHQGLATWARFTVAAGMILIMGASSLTALFGYGLAMLIVVISELLFFRKTIFRSDNATHPLSASSNVWKMKMYSYAWPIAAWALLTWVNLVSGRWSLEFFSTTQVVGYYAVLYQVGYYPVTIIASLVSQLAKPVLYQWATDAKDPFRVVNVYRISLLLISVGLVLTLTVSGIAFFAHEIIFSTLVGEEFRSVSWLLPGMILAAGFYSSSQICATAIHAHLKTKSLIIPNNIAHAAGLILSLVGAALYGLAGVVIANIIFSLIHFLWILLLYVRSFLNLKLEIKNATGLD